MSAAPVDPDRPADPGAVLRQLREARGHTLQGVALLSGLPATTLFAFERNRSTPDLADVIALAKVYRLSPERFAEQLGVPLPQRRTRRVRS